jgi:hypothetical protein
MDLKNVKIWQKIHLSIQNQNFPKNKILLSCGVAAAVDKKVYRW